MALPCFPLQLVEILNGHIIVILNGFELHIRHPNLLPLINERCTLHKEIHVSQRFGRCLPVFLIVTPSRR
ncbi:hypothetical protein D3C72_711580 [compost metagenome]